MRGLAATVLVLALAGCGRTVPTVELELGGERFRVVLPEGWEHLDQGREQVFRHGEHRIVFRDLGPAGPAGVLRELEQARAALHAGRPSDAVQRVNALRVPAALFPVPGPAEAYWHPWGTIAGDPLHAEPGELEMALDLLEDQALELREPALDTLALASWERIEDDERRALRGVAARTIAGRPGQLVETWDRVAHTTPRRHAFFVAGGRLIALSTWIEVDPAVPAAFEELLGSLVPASPAAPGRDAPAVTSGDQGATGR